MVTDSLGRWNQWRPFHFVSPHFLWDFISGVTTYVETARASLKYLIVLKVWRFEVIFAFHYLCFIRTCRDCSQKAKARNYKSSAVAVTWTAAAFHARFLCCFLNQCRKICGWFRAKKFSPLLWLSPGSNPPPREPRRLPALALFHDVQHVRRRCRRRRPNGYRSNEQRWRGNGPGPYCQRRSGPQRPPPDRPQHNEHCWRWWVDQRWFGCSTLKCWRVE